jgi:hypothetical protein
MDSTGRHIRAGVFACLVGCFFTCGSPFFPDTGTPVAGPELRATPEGTVRQLVQSYENRRFDLFEELLYSPEDFRFYVELDPLVYSGLTKISTDRTEKVDLDNDYILDGEYVYLTYSEETAIHRKLFLQATDITFEKRLEVLTVEYPTPQREPSLFTDSANTAIAMVRTDDASIRISAELLKQTYPEGWYVFPVGPQVFYLKKDAEGLWRILLWFELAD